VQHGGKGLNSIYTNCAYWAAEKRPDVWVNAVWKYGDPPGDGAWAIKLDAEKAGYSLNHSPEAGDLAVWKGGETTGKYVGGFGEGSTGIAGGPNGEGGHVVYVGAVDRPGAVTTSEMGVGGIEGCVTGELEYDAESTWFIHATKGS
jgi:surface antigen